MANIIKRIIIFAGLTCTYWILWLLPKPCNKICVENYCFIADCSSKVPDDKALVIPEVPVNGQLRLPGNLSGKGRKQIKFNDSAKTHIYWFPSDSMHHHLYSRISFIHTTIEWGRLVWRMTHLDQWSAVKSSSSNYEINTDIFFTNSAQGNSVI